MIITGKTITQLPTLPSITSDTLFVVDYSGTTYNIPYSSVVSTGSTSNYKIYTALLAQTGTNNPVATVLENTIGDIVWTRLNTGEYLGTLTGAFSANKTWSSITTSNFGTNSCAILGITRNSANEVYISTVDPTTAPYYTDNFLYQSPIEIRVYN